MIYDFDLVRIAEHLALRLHRVVGDVQTIPSQGQPELPGIVIGTPTVESFNNDFGTCSVTTEWELSLLVGRQGDLDSALRMLYSMIPAVADTLTMKPRELPKDPDPWSRLTVDSTSGISTDGDMVAVTMNLTIDT